MFFCQNCDNVFDIMKGETKQSGGVNNKDLITKILKNVTLDAKEMKDLESINIDEFIHSPEYNKLKSNQKEFVYNKIQELLPLEFKKILTEEIKQSADEKAYFVCNNCGNKKAIRKGTLIFSKVSSDIAQSYSSADVSEMKYSDILPRTRKYICPNDECPSHTNYSVREAVFFRMNNTFRVKHICLACDYVF